MKTGGFSRFARKPAPKESADGISGVGGKSETLAEQNTPSYSNDGPGNWNSSDFGGGFGFDGGLDDMPFGGEIQHGIFPVPKPMEKRENPIQNKKLFAAPGSLKSPPTAKFDNSSSGGIIFPKAAAANMSPPPSKLYNSSYALKSHGNNAAPPVITPAPVTKKSDSIIENCARATNDGHIADSFERPPSPFHASNDTARVNPRRVTLGGTDALHETSKISFLEEKMSDAQVIQQGAPLASPQVNAMSAQMQSAPERAMYPTEVSKDETSDVLMKTSENESSEIVTAEPDLVDSATGSFEDMFQCIMSKNLQFEDSRKNFEDKILDLSADLSMKHGDILEIEQSALHLKREMGLKFEFLLSQVEL